MLRPALLAFGCCALFAQSAAPPARAPVLVELFTSEGCSDCPPADHMLAQLDPHVVVLSEHVDYWDHDGWKDPFSMHSNTVRQEEYATRFHIDGPYTPEMVVDGSEQFVGSDAKRAQAVIEKAAQSRKAQVKLARADGAVQIDIAESPASAGVFIAVAEDSAASDVAAGENKGRHLQHVSVLRSLRKIGSVKRGAGFSQKVSIPAAANERVVVFLQEGTTGPVVGAAELSR